MPQAVPSSVSTFDARLLRGVVVVVVILATVAMLAVIAAGSLRRIRSGPAGGATATASTMRIIVTGLKGYRADKGSYPASLEALMGERFIEQAPVDAWGRPLLFAAPGLGGREFALLSLGADGERGTEDDIDWWAIESGDRR